MKKKLMILLVVTLFLTMIFSTGCKKKFDITGSWTLVETVLGITLTSTITFTGDSDSGTFIEQYEANTYNGTYTVNGDNVEWIHNGGATYSGTHTDDNHMSGTANGFFSSTWTATR